MKRFASSSTRPFPVLAFCSILLGGLLPLCASFEILGKASNLVGSLVLSGGNRKLKDGFNWQFETSGNFSEWREHLDAKLQDTCLHVETPMQFESLYTVSSAGDSVFQSLKTTKGYIALQEVLLTSSFGSYINTVAGWIAFICFGGIFLFLFITTLLLFLNCCCFKRGNRKGASGRRSSRLIKRPLATGVAVVVCITFLAIFGIWCCVELAVFDKGVYASLCDGYVTFKGFWFGANISAPAPGIERDWKGNHVQWEALQALLTKVTPGPQNPLKAHIEAVYQNEVKPGMISATKALTDEADKMGVIAVRVQKMVARMVTDLKIGEVTPPHNYPVMQLTAGYTYLLQSKLTDFKKEAVEAKDAALKAFEENIETNLGTKSLLFKEATLASSNAVTSLGDVNSVMARLTKDIVDAEPLILSAKTALTVVLSIWIFVSFFLIFFGIVVYVLAFRANEDTSSPPPRYVRRCLLALYVLAGVFGTTSFVVSGVLFLVGNVGADVCQVLNKTVMTEGNWDAFPKSLWYDTAYGSTDMATVLNTCVKSSGKGDVASALGISGSLMRLIQTTEKTKTSLRQQLGAMLQVDKKKEELKLLQALAVASSYYWWPDPTSSMDSAIINLKAGHFPKIPYTKKDLSGTTFPYSTKYIIPRNLKPSEEPLRVLCLFPALAGLKKGLPDQAFYCVQDPVLGMIGTGTLVNIMNHKLSSDVPANSTDPQIIRSVCTKSLEDDTSFTCPPSAIIIDSTWPIQKELNDKEEVAKTRAAIATKDAEAAKKFNDAIFNAVYLEKVLNYSPDLSFYPELKCPNQKKSCPIKELIPAIEQTMIDGGAQLAAGFNNLTAIAVNFVENTTIGAMNALEAESTQTLTDFNCQYIGSSIKNGLVRGLCHKTFPGSAMLAFNISCLFISCVTLAIITFFAWQHATHYMATVGTTPSEAEACTVDSSVGDRQISVPNETLPPS